MNHDAVGDRFTALVVLLAILDKELRSLAGQLISDPDTDQNAVLWLTVSYARRTFPCLILGTSATRNAIINHLDNLRESMTFADELSQWRTP